MPSNDFHERPSNFVPDGQNPYPERTDLTGYHNLEQHRLERLSQEVADLKLASQSDTKNYRREVSRLRGRLGLLTGISIAVIAILGGTLAWLGFGLKAQQDQLAEQVRSITAERAATERIERLESQIRSLSQQVPETLTNELRGTQSRLRELETQLKEIAANNETWRQAIARLEKALQTLTNQGETTPSESNSPASGSNSSNKSNNSN